MAHPVGINAKTLANKSIIDRRVKPTIRPRAVTRAMAVTP